MKAAEHVRQADREARGLIRRRGRPRKTLVSLTEVEAAEAQAIRVYDLWCWLVGEIRQALEPVSSGHLATAASSRATLETAVELMRGLGHPEITAFADDLEEKIPQLLAPLEWLEQHLQPVLQGVDARTQAFLLWAWEHRQPLGLDIAVDIPEELQAVAKAVWEILGLFHRSSSLAESLHSWLRPYLEIHRGMCRWLLPLLQLYWNHHELERGKRAGHSPLELAGVKDVLPLKEVLGQLVSPGQAVQPA